MVERNLIRKYTFEFISFWVPIVVLGPRKPTEGIIGTQTEIRKVKLKIKIIFILFTFQCLCLPIIPCRLTKRVFNRKYFLPTLYMPTPNERKKGNRRRASRALGKYLSLLKTHSLCPIGNSISYTIVASMTEEKENVGGDY